MPARENIFSLHLSTATSWRGGENQIWLLAKGLHARGQRVLVLAPLKAPLLERCREAGVPCRGIGLRGRSAPLGILRLAQVLKRERPDILHLHDGHAIVAGRFAARLARIKSMRVVVHRRTVFPVRGRWAFSSGVDAVVAISEAVRAELLKARVPPELIRVVHSGLEFPAQPAAEALAAFKRKHALPDGALIIGHAAAFTAEKRQSDMLEALALANEKLKAQGRPSVHLALAGSGVLEETLRAQTRLRGLEQNVHFPGFLRDLAPLWAVSCMALYASAAEGLCTALIEAQGAGLPAVITRAGGMTEVVDENRTGLSAPVGDVAALAAHIVKLAGDEKLRQAMGAAAARRARERFSADAMVEGILDLYRELS